MLRLTLHKDVDESEKDKKERESEKVIEVAYDVAMTILLKKSLCGNCGNCLVCEIVNQARLDSEELLASVKTVH